MPVMPYLTAVSGFSSVLSLPTLTRPAYSSASLSMVGVRARHGPHQGAQKSTSTGLSLWTTSCFQLSVVKVATFALAMIAHLSWEGVTGVDSDRRRADCALL